MKKLFDFRIKKTTTETREESSKNEKGETVTISKDVETVVSQKVVLRKPNRSLYDEAELFYGVRLSEGIKAGLLTRALLAKRFSNDGGILSDDDKNKYADLYLKLYDIQLEHDRLAQLGSKKRTKTQEKKLAELQGDLAVIKKELTDFEMAQSSLFEQTAENRARNKTILWWTLHLGYLSDEDDKMTPVFAGETYEEKLAIYDEMEESSEEFTEELLSKLLYYVSFWYVGKVNSEDEFKQLLAETEQAENAATEPEEDSAKAEGTPTVKKTPPPQKKNEEPKAKAEAK
tara:strand:+ start:67 stop:930 length:864 start_codon:yes stop_codon:yes gene_type:complete